MAVQANPEWIATPHRPPSARSNGHRLCIIAPSRDRAKHLKVLLTAFEAGLLRAEAGANQRPPCIFIVEQSGSGPFNRGKLCNVGFDLNRQD